MVFRKNKKPLDGILSRGFNFLSHQDDSFKTNKTVNYNTVTFVAAGPFCPSSMSNETRSPSFKDLNPVELIPE